MRGPKPPIRPGAVLGLTLLLSTLAASPACTKTTSGTTDDHVIDAIWTMAVAQEQQGDAVGVALTLRRAMDDEIFRWLSQPRQYEVAHLYAQASHVIGDWEEAHRGYVVATEKAPASQLDWTGRLFSATLVADAEDAHTSLKRLSAFGAPAFEAFDGQTVRHLSQLLRGLPERDAALAVGRQLEREEWNSAYAFEDVSDVWLYHALILMERGREADALRAVQRITRPEAIMAIQADRRFDGLVRATPALQDADAAAVRALEAARTYAAQNPRRLDGVLAVARALITLNRQAEALAVLDGATRGLARSKPSAPVFDDLHLAYLVTSWTSAVLLDLGRTEEAAAIRVQAARGEGNPLFAVNAARGLLNAGRPKEAWEWTEPLALEGLGPADRMDVMQTRACAAAAADQQMALQGALAYLRANESWKPRAYTHALLCSGRMAEAEAALVRQLADPRTRLAALASVQRTAAPPSASAYFTMLEERRRALAERPAVQAAIDKVGRRQTFRLVDWAQVG